MREDEPVCKRRIQDRGDAHARMNRLSFAALGGSAVLLSAALPRRRRAQLIDAFRSGLDAPPAVLAEQDYPLATLAAPTR